MCFAPQRRALFPTSQLPKVVRHWGVLYILTSKCASRHNGVHFLDISTSKSGPTLRCFVHFHFEMCFAPQRRALFDISTSKSGPIMVCFVHFHFEMCFAPQRRALFRHLNFQKCSTMVCFVHIDFEMCFAPQRRALFRHLNFQKCSDSGVLCTFWVANVLRATTACTFSSLIWPAGSAPAALASLLFDPPEPQIIGKTQCFATFLPFRASASSFFWLFLFSDLLSSTLSLLSASALLCFSSVHIVGSLTSQLPSIIDTGMPVYTHQKRMETQRETHWRSEGCPTHSYSIVPHWALGQLMKRTSNWWIIKDLIRSI